MNEEPIRHERLTATNTTTGGGLPLAETMPVQQVPVQQVPVQQVPVQQVPVQQVPVQQVIDDPFVAPVDRAVVTTPPAAPVVSVVPVTGTEHLRESETSSTRWRVSPASVMAAASSVAFMLWGAVVLARAGTDAPLDEPAVEVAAFSGTAILGLIVLGGGAMLLIAAFSRSRAAIAFVSIVLGVAAGAIAIEPTWGQAALAADRDGAIAALVLLVITAAVALVAPDVERVAQRRDEWRA